MITNCIASLNEKKFNHIKREDYIHPYAKIIPFIKNHILKFSIINYNVNLSFPIEENIITILSKNSAYLYICEEMKPFYLTIVLISGKV